MREKYGPPAKSLPSILSTRSVSQLEDSFLWPKSQFFQAIQTDSGLNLPEEVRFDSTISIIDAMVINFCGWPWDNTEYMEYIEPDFRTLQLREVGTM